MWDDVEIVTLDEAKTNAGITDTDREHDLELKLRQAHGYVLDYVSSRNSSSSAAWLAEMLTWDGDTAPPAIQGAIMAAFAYLVMNRGDDEPKPNFDGNSLPPEIKWRLARYHDPALA